MKSKYTYDDFVKKANEYGGLDGISEADKKLAMQFPDAGISILQYQRDFKNAATDEARALAHAGAESIRSQYGNYSGGNDGASFYLKDPTPISYENNGTPEYQSQYGEKINGALADVLNRKDYESPYSERLDEALKQLTEGNSFTYDKGSDPVYQAYAKEYRREGERAVADTMGSASSMTGGIPSSYAVSAAGQAGDYYATQLSDKLPALEAQAYERYQGKQKTALEALSAADATAYQRYIDELGLDQDDLNTILSLDAADYEKFRDALSQYNTDRSFDYGKWMDHLYYRGDQDEAAREQRNFETELALDKEESDAARSKAAYENELEKALYAAEYFGDYSLLKKILGRA